VLPVWKPKVEHPRSGLNLLLAVGLFISPWVLRFHEEPRPAWTAWLTALAIAIVVGAETIRLAEWQEWASVALGIWLVVAPLFVGFTANAIAQWTHIVAGVLVIAVTAWGAWVFGPKRPMGLRR